MSLSRALTLKVNCVGLSTLFPLNSTLSETIVSAYSTLEFVIRLLFIMISVATIAGAPPVCEAIVTKKLDTLSSIGEKVLSESSR